MAVDEWKAARFEESREHLRSVAYRMLGSLSEADDAVQEAWLRLSRADTSAVENLAGWLTTVVARICLDMLRSRRSRREEPLDRFGAEPAGVDDGGIDPEQEAILADSVGLALLVVLETLAPAERLAFVLHDMFAVSFEEIAPIVGRTPSAARQLASRGRRRVQGVASVPEVDLDRQREVVQAFLAASREGDFAALLAALDPDVVFRSDATATAPGTPREMRGAPKVAQQFVGRAVLARVALVNGSVGVVVAPRGQLLARAPTRVRERTDLGCRSRRRPRAPPAARPGGPRRARRLSRRGLTVGVRPAGEHLLSMPQESRPPYPHDLGRAAPATSNPFSSAVHHVDRVTSRPITAVVVVLLIVIFGIALTIAGFPQAWETSFATVCAAITTVMVFTIQHTQSREQAATQLKLDELIRAMPRADDRLVHVESGSDEELAELEQRQLEHHSSLRAED